MLYGIVTADNSRIKIGTAALPKQRLKELQTGSPQKLKLVAVLKGDHSEEAKLHREFHSYRTNGEWFINNGAIVQYLVANSTLDFWESPLTEIISMHPALKSLWFDALIARAKGNDYSRIEHFIRLFKPRINFLVGWQAGKRTVLHEKEDSSPLYSAEELRKHTKTSHIFSVYEDLKTSATYSIVYDWVMNLLPEVD